MRKHMNVFVVLGVFAFAAVPVVASAATLGGEVFGAFNSYSMGDVNDALDASNQAGANFDEISSGITGGLALRMWANPNWMFAAGWEPLFAESKDDVTDTTIDAGGNSFQLTAGYFFPTATSAKYGIAAGLGYYSLNGEQSNPTTTTDVSGNSVGFHFLGMGEWTVSPGFAVTGGAGYRVADVTVDETSPESSVDYSGFMGRVGLAFYMPNSSQ